MDFPAFTWVNEHTAVNLDRVSHLHVHQGVVSLFMRGVEPPIVVLSGDDAECFLSWFNRHAASSRNDC